MNNKLDNHILLAYAFDGNGHGIPINGKQAVLELKNDDLAWVHLDANNPNTATWLKKEVSYLDQIIVDALLADETRPRVMEFDEGSLIIFRGVNLNQNARPEDMVSIRLWIDSYRIISIQRRDLIAIHTIENSIKGGKAIKNAGEFVSILCHELAECLELFLEELGSATDEIEGRILETRGFDLRENTITIRKQAIMLKRHLAPQRDVVGKLVNCNQDWVSDIDKRNFQESHNHLIRYVEDLDEIRERSQIVHDELTNAITERVNRNMYVLSVIASVFLPLTFVTGLFGMNVSDIPVNNIPGAFYIVTGAMGIIVGLQILIFKKKKWF